MNDSGNFSSAGVSYSTVSAFIGVSTGSVVTVTFDPNAGATFSNVIISGGMLLGGNLPPGALTTADTLLITPNSTPPQNTPGVTLLGGSVDISLGSGIKTFNKPMTLTFGLSGPALLNAQAAGPNFVKIAFYNGTRWVIVPDSTFDGVGTVSGMTSHLTQFAVVIVQPVADLSNAMVYPNPYRPSIPAHLAQGITFDILPANTSLKIYTLAGELVRDLYDTAGIGSIKWDGKNSNGQSCASGVYWVILNGGGTTKTMKVAIQR